MAKKDVKRLGTRTALSKVRLDASYQARLKADKALARSMLATYGVDKADVACIEAQDLGQMHVQFLDKTSGEGLCTSFKMHFVPGSCGHTTETECKAAVESWLGSGGKPERKTRPKSGPHLGPRGQRQGKGKRQSRFDESNVPMPVS